jgi:hypothetical protein
MTLAEMSIANQFFKTFAVVMEPPVHYKTSRLRIPNSGTPNHIFSTCTLQHIFQYCHPPTSLTPTGYHTYQNYVTEITRIICLKPVAAKMFLNYLMTGDTVGLVEKTSDLGNEG